MVRRRKKITIVLFMNVATEVVPAFCLGLELAIVFLTFLTSAYYGNWSQWSHCLYSLYGMFCIWGGCIFTAALICRKRLIIEGQTLRITKGRETIYQCEISEIKSVERLRFAPLTQSFPGGILIVNYVHPVPKDLDICMSWISYKRVLKLIRRMKTDQH